MTERDTDLSRRIVSSSRPSLQILRDIWRYQPLSTPPPDLSRYSGAGEETILAKMGIIDLATIVDTSERGQAELLVTNVFGGQKQNWLTRFVGLPYREFKGVMLRGKHLVGETPEPVCALVICDSKINDGTKLTIEAGWGAGAEILETKDIVWKRLLQRYVKTEVELKGDKWEISKINAESGFEDRGELDTLIASLASFGSTALNALQIEYNLVFNRRLRRNGLITAVGTVAAILALFGHPPLKLTQESGFPTRAPSPTADFPPATAVATTDWEVDRRRLIDQDETLLRTGSLTETGYFDNNFISGTRLEVGEDSKQHWFDALREIKLGLPDQLQNMPLGILKVIREDNGGIPTVVMETVSGEQYPIIDIPSLAINILEWTMEGNNEDQKVKDRIINDLLTTWKLEGMRDLVSISRDVYNRPVVTLTFEPAGRTVTYDKIPVNYSWGPDSDIFPLLRLPTIMSYPFVDSENPSAVIRIKNQFGSLYCLVAPGENSKFALDFLATYDVSKLPVNLNLIGSSSRLQNISNGQTVSYVGFATLSFPSAETVTVQGQKVAASVLIPCLPIFVPHE